MNVHVAYVTWQFHNKTLVIIFIHKKKKIGGTTQRRSAIQFLAGQELE